MISWLNIDNGCPTRPSISHWIGGEHWLSCVSPTNFTFRGSSENWSKFRGPNILKKLTKPQKGSIMYREPNILVKLTIPIKRCKNWVFGITFFDPTFYLCKTNDNFQIWEVLASLAKKPILYNLLGLSEGKHLTICNIIRQHQY